MEALSARERAEILRSVDALAGWSDDELLELAAHFDTAARTAGTLLTMEGRNGQELLVVVDGSAKASSDGEVIATLGPGAFFGDMYVICHAMAPFTVVASTGIRLLVLTHAGFVRLLLSSPGVAFRLSAAIARRTRDIGGYVRKERDPGSDRELALAGG